MSYWKLYYHFVWSTKERQPLIDAGLETALYQAVAAKVQKMGGTVHAIGGTSDHTHLAVSVPPKIALAKFIGDVKGNSSHFVNHVVQPGFEFHWHEEYGVLSFSEKSLPAIVKYIRNQKRHHADNSTMTALERDTDPLEQASESPPGGFAKHP